MTIDRIFLVFMAVCGAATGLVLVLAPEMQSFRISPYFWVLIAMALFEGLAFWRGGGAPGTTISMEVRLLGFVIAIVLTIAIPILAGSPARLF